MANADDIDPSEICARGSITTAEVAAIRRGYYRDGIVSEAEAGALFAIEQESKTQAAEWAPLFVEALTDYVVHQVPPAGYVSPANAVWLMERVAPQGKVTTRNEFDLLVSVIDQARFAPAALGLLALSQIRDAVKYGLGPLRPAGGGKRGVVGESDVALLRRVLYATGGEGSIGITRGEAELLFDIADAADEAACHPSWPDLFAKALANHVMTAGGYQVPSRQEALRQDEFLTSRRGAKGFPADTVGLGLKGVFAAYRTPGVEDLALARIEAERRAMLVDETVTAPEAAWLSERIGRDGKLGQAERGLLMFLKTESPKIDPALVPLLARVA